MTTFFAESLFFGFSLCLIGYGLGIFIRRKLKSPIFNPLLIAILFNIGVLVIFDIDYEVYHEGAKYLSYLLTPATVCLAIPMYQQIALLRKNATAIISGIVSGVLASLGSIYVIARMLSLTHQQYVTLLPKSITTAIGIGVSEELGGMVTISVAIIIMTGLVGGIFAGALCRILRIKEPLAKGIAIGSSTHAIGTTKAMELGPIEGAASSLSIVVSGFLTVIGASIFSTFI